MKAKLISLLLTAVLILSTACACVAEEYIINDVDFSRMDDAQRDNPVFYEIFVGSFSDSDGDGTGDIRGIISRLDYLNDGDPLSGKSLGVEGIWLTPVFASPSYHKYDVTDYYTVDPAFGTNDDLEELVALCHERGIRVILDLPVNHMSSRGSLFRNFINAHICHNPANKYYDLFTWIDASAGKVPAGRHFTRSPAAGIMYESNFSDDMPELNYDNPEVRTMMLDVARFWLDKGVDGFRFDAAKYIYYGDNAKSADFWAWYTGELKKIKPDVFTVAEVWDGDGVIMKYAGIMNCFNFTASQASGIIAETANKGDVNRFTAYTESCISSLKALREDAANVFFIANHDTDRAAGYLTVASGNMKTAATLYLLSPGTPFIYYGEEIGLRGSRGGANTDANRRLAMLWGDGDTVKDPVGTTYDASKQTPYAVSDLITKDSSIYTHYKKLLMLRKANPEIASGEYHALKLSGTKLGGFTATLNGSAVAVLHNTTQRDMTVDLSEIQDLPCRVLTDSVGAGEAELTGTVLTVPGQTSVILR